MQKIAGAIEKTDTVKAAELVRQLEKLDELAAAGLDPTIVKAVRDDLTGATKKAADELARLNGLLDATPTAKLESARSDMLLLTAALEKGTIAEEQYLEAVIARLDTMSEKTQAAVGELDEFTKAAAKNIQGALADFLFDPFSEGLEGMARKFADVIRRMAADAIAAQIAKKLFGAMGKSGEMGAGSAAPFSAASTAVGFHQGGMVGAGGSFSRVGAGLRLLQRAALPQRRVRRRRSAGHPAERRAGNDQGAAARHEVRRQPADKPGHEFLRPGRTRPGKARRRIRRPPGARPAEWSAPLWLIFSKSACPT